MSRRNYDRQFKMTAVRSVLDNNVTVCRVAKELSIHYNSLYRWIAEYEEYGERAFLGSESVLSKYQYEIIKTKT